MFKHQLQSICATAAAILFVLAGEASAGVIVGVYATVQDARQLTFNPSTGELYAGRDGYFSGGTFADYERIHRIGDGGTPVVEYGADRKRDPDTIAYDAFGLVSGTPGSILVGGGENLSSGRIMAILPDESTATVLTTPSALNDIDGMYFDSTGRLIFSNDNLYSRTGGTTSLIDSFGSYLATTVVVDSTDRIFTYVTDGTVKLYDSSGTLIDGAFATGDIPAIAYAGSGALFAEGLYGLVGGDLVHFESSGSQTVLGTVFADPAEAFGTLLEFGPDGALYASYPMNDQVLRITPDAVPEPSTLLIWSIGLVGMTCVGSRRKRGSK